MRALAWAVTIGSFVGAASLLNVVRDPANPVYLGYLSVPPPQIAGIVGGFRSLAADAYYMRFACYWGYQLTRGRHFSKNMVEILQEITDLDPRFKAAYELGGIALGDAGWPLEASKLLDKGSAHSPQDWWFPYQTGMITFFYSDDFMAAARYFERASRMPHAGPEAAYMAARMYEKSSRRDLAVSIWRRTLAGTSDKSIRQVAKNALKRLHADD